MISVIIPIYNVEKYLCRCLDSIISQSYKDLEIILVDDGSPDNSPSICDSYARNDNRIKVIHKTNGGLSAARNTGLKYAMGDFISFIDSDDYIEPKMYEILFNLITKFDSDISMCGCNVISENGDLLYVDQFRDGSIFHGSGLLDEIILPLKTASWNKLYRRSSIQSCFFPEGRIHGEDLVFMMQFVSDKTSLVTSSYNGYNYIKRENSITTSSFNKRAFDEVWCKDTAYSLVLEKFPSFNRRALLWSFNARLNLIRKMYFSNTILDYISVIEDYKIWLSDNYTKLSSLLCFKIKFEYVLIIKFPSFYKFYNKLYKVLK